MTRITVCAVMEPGDHSAGSDRLGVMTDETSKRIKRAALSRFVEVGFGSTTVDEVAASAES